MKRYDAPPLPPVAKVNATKVAIKPSDETVAWMQKKWEMIVTPKTGCKDYGEMLATYKSEQTASS